MASGLASSVLPSVVMAAQSDTAPDGQDTQQKLATGLQTAFAKDAPVGLAGAVWRDGQMLWQGQAGLRVAGEETPIGSADLWHLGSNTKAMTAALWARLVEQGKLRWDMPVNEAVTAAGLDVQLHAGWHDRTVEDFMRHRAGLLDARYVNGIWLMASRTDTRSLPAQRAAFAKRILEAAPEGPLGTFEYGNANYILVGSLIEGVTGLAWEEVMQQELFAPLGMTSAGFGAPEGQQPHGHTWSGDKATGIGPDAPVSDNPKALGPAGTAHMSLADYGLFLAAMLQPGWLSQDSLTRLQTPLENETYALGWIAPGTRRWAGGPALLHNGSNTIWFATVVLAPVIKLAFVSVSNDGTRGGEACSTLMIEMIEALTANAK